MNLNNYIDRIMSKKETKKQMDSFDKLEKKMKTGLGITFISLFSSMYCLNQSYVGPTELEQYVEKTYNSYMLTKEEQSNTQKSDKSMLYVFAGFGFLGVGLMTPFVIGNYAQNYSKKNQSISYTNKKTE